MRTFAPNATRTQPRVSSCLAPSSTLTSVTNHQARFVHSADDKLSRLVPFGEDALIEEEAILDSKRPAFVQNVHLIVTIFGNRAPPRPVIPSRPVGCALRGPAPI